MHLNEDQIQRFLHGELDPRSREALSLHAAECNACAKRLAEAEEEESEIFGLLGHLDHPAPRVDASSVSGGGAMGTWARRAAVFVAVAALAGAAYALPGSPLPTWLKKAAELIAGERESPSGGGYSIDAPAGPVTSGIAVPAPERFAIVFLAEQSEGTVVVTLTDAPSIVVRALGGAVTFTTDVDRLTIDNRNSVANYEIEVPRAAEFVEILVDLRRIVVKDKDQFAEGLERDSGGRAVLPLKPTE